MLIFYSNAFIYTKDEINKLLKYHYQFKSTNLQIPFYTFLQQYLLNSIKDFKSQYRTQEEYINSFAVLDLDLYLEEARYQTMLVNSKSNTKIPVGKYLKYQIHNFKEQITKHLLIQQPLYYTSLYINFFRELVTEQDKYQSILRTVLNTVLYNHFDYINKPLTTVNELDRANLSTYSSYVLAEIQDSQFYRSTSIPRKKLKHPTL